MVTHDRSLMARIATRVIEVNDGRVVLYPGGYDDYESTRLAREEAARAAAASPPAQRSAAGSPGRRGAAASGSERPGGGTRQRRGGNRPREPRQDKEVSRLTREIETREQRVRVLEGQLADPVIYHDGNRARELVTEYDRLRAELESLWQRMSELV